MGARGHERTELPNNGLDEIIRVATTERLSRRIEHFGPTAITLTMEEWSDQEDEDQLKLNEMVIQAGRNTGVNRPDGSYETPLTLAIRKKRPEHVRLLLGAGVDVNQRDLVSEMRPHPAEKSELAESVGLSPLMLAASLGRLEIYKMLLAAKAKETDLARTVALTIDGWLRDPSRAETYHWILRDMLVEANLQYELCQLRAERTKGSTNSEDVRFHTELSQLRKLFCNAFIEGIENGRLTDDHHEDGAREAIFDLVRALAPFDLGFLNLDGVTDPELMDRKANWALVSNFDLAMQYPKALRLYFMACGVERDVIDRLRYEGIEPTTAIVQILCEFPIDLNREIVQGCTPLEWVIAEGTVDDVANVLRAHGKLPDREGLLNVAIQSHNPETVKLLLARGADPNGLFDSHTPLEWAADELADRQADHPGVVRIVRLLLDNGADIKALPGMTCRFLESRGVLL